MLQCKYNTVRLAQSSSGAASNQIQIQAPQQHPQNHHQHIQIHQLQNQQHSVMSQMPQMAQPAINFPMKPLPYKDIARPPPEVLMSINSIQLPQHPVGQEILQGVINLPTPQNQGLVGGAPDPLQQMAAAGHPQPVTGAKKRKKGAGPKKVRIPREGEKEKKFSCQFCDFKSSTNYNVTAHVKSVHCKIKDFTCQYCDFKSSKKWNLKSHVKTVHEKVKNFPCNFCDYRSSRKDALVKHYSDVHQKMK